MYKATPNPPEPETHPNDHPSSQLFTVVDGIDTESLLANLSETLASADAMINDLAPRKLPAPSRPWHLAADRAEWFAGKPDAG